MKFNFVNLFQINCSYFILTKKAIQTAGLYIYPKIEGDLEHQNLRNSIY